MCRSLYPNGRVGPEPGRVVVGERPGRDEVEVDVATVEGSRRERCRGRGVPARAREVVVLVRVRFDVDADPSSVEADAPPLPAAGAGPSSAGASATGASSAGASATGSVASPVPPSERTSSAATGSVLASSASALSELCPSANANRSRNDTNEASPRLVARRRSPRVPGTHPPPPNWCVVLRLTDGPGPRPTAETVVRCPDGIPLSRGTPSGEWPDIRPDRRSSPFGRLGWARDSERGRGPRSGPGPFLLPYASTDLRGLALRPAPAGRRDHGHADPEQDHRDEPQPSRIRTRERGRRVLVSGGFSPAIGVTVASSSELTEWPRMSSPVAVPTLVTGSSPTTKSFVSVTDSPGLEDLDVPDVPHDVVVDADVVQRGVAGVRHDVGEGHRRADRHRVLVHRFHDLDARMDEVGGTVGSVSSTGGLGLGARSPPPSLRSPAGRGRCRAPRSRTRGTRRHQPRGCPGMTPRDLRARCP